MYHWLIDSWFYDTRLFKLSYLCWHAAKVSITLYHKTSTCFLFSNYLSVHLSVNPTDAAAPDCAECWRLLVTLCPSSALLSLFLYFLCSHMGRTSSAFIHWKSFCTSFDCVVSCNSNSVSVSVRAGKHPGVSQETRPLATQLEVSDSSDLIEYLDALDVAMWWQHKGGWLQDTGFIVKPSGVVVQT